MTNDLTDNIFAVDCQWSTWGQWSPCSKTCGMATRERTRTEAQEAMNGGAACQGIATQLDVCTSISCPTTTTTTTTQGDL